MSEKYERVMNSVLKEVEKILKENCKTQGIHLDIDMQIGETPVINFKVKNRFPEM